MKYMNIEIASALVTSIVISLVMYYLNRNNKEQITLKTHIKTFAINSLIIVGLLYLKKNVLDKQSIGVMTGGNIDPPVISPVEYNDISVGTPNF
jgi:hypothetical protein